MQRTCCILRKNGQYERGIAYIAACLRHAGFDVGIIDGPVCNLKDKDILNKIQAFKPKVIGISAITPVKDGSKKSDYD